MSHTTSGKTHEVSQEDEKTILGWPFLEQLSRHTRENDLVKWVTDEKIVGLLVDFKRDNIDQPERYEQLRQWLGPDGRSWEGITAGMMVPSSRRTSNDAQTQLIDGLVATIKKLVEVAEVGVKEMSTRLQC